MPRSPEDAEKAADKLKLEGDARAAFVARLSAGYVPPEASIAPPAAPAPPAPKVEVAPAPKPATPAAPKPRYSALASPPPAAPAPKPPAPAPPPAAPRYAALTPGMEIRPITNEELGESPTLSNEALGESQQPPPRTGPGRPGEAPRYVVPAQMADVRKADASVYRREAPKDTYFKAVPAPTVAPDLGESEVEMPPASAPAAPGRADYDFLLSRGYPQETLDEVLATEGAKGIAERATYWRSRQ